MLYKVDDSGVCCRPPYTGDTSSLARAAVCNDAPVDLYKSILLVY